MKILGKSEAEQQKILCGLVAAAMADLNYSETDIKDVVYELEHTFKTIDDVTSLQIYKKFIEKTIVN